MENICWLKNPEFSKNVTALQPQWTILFNPQLRNFEKAVQVQSESKLVCEIKGLARGWRFETCPDDIPALCQKLCVVF